MRWPWVSRETMEAWQAHAERADARFDALMARYLEAVTPKPVELKKPVLTGEAKQSDEQIVREAEQGFVAKLRDDLVRQGIPRGDAEKEAHRIRQEAMSTTLHS